MYVLDLSKNCDGKIVWELDCDSKFVAIEMFRKLFESYLNSERLQCIK